MHEGYLCLTRNDALVVTAWNSVSDQVLTVRGRYQDPSGEIHPIEGTLRPTADRTENSLTIRLGEGYLLGVSVRTAVTTQRGQTFVRLAIAQGLGASPPEYLVLAQDYVTVASALAWPGGRISSPTEGPGAIRSITGTDPAAGQEISETVPTNTRWRFVSILALLTTDATVASRVAYWAVDDGSTLLFTGNAGLTQGVSSTEAYSLIPSYSQRGDIGGNRVLAVPSPLILQAGWRIRSSTTNLQAGDNWGAPRFSVEEWIDL